MKFSEGDPMSVVPTRIRNPAVSKVPGILRVPDYVVFDMSRGAYGMYLQLTGPFRYPTWTLDLYEATGLHRVEAHQYAAALGTCTQVEKRLNDGFRGPHLTGSEKYASLGDF